MDSAKVIGPRLAATREALGLKAAALCKILKCKPNRWSQYESGQRRITLTMASKLRQEFGIPLDWTYCGDPAQLPLKLRHIRRSDEVA